MNSVYSGYRIIRQLKGPSKLCRITRFVELYDVYIKDKHSVGQTKTCRIIRFVEFYDIELCDIHCIYNLCPLLLSQFIS